MRTVTPAPITSPARSSRASRHYQPKRRSIRTQMAGRRGNYLASSLGFFPGVVANSGLTPSLEPGPLPFYAANNPVARGRGPGTDSVYRRTAGVHTARAHLDAGRHVPRRLSRVHPSVHRLPGQAGQRHLHPVGRHSARRQHIERDFNLRDKDGHRDAQRRHGVRRRGPRRRPSRPMGPGAAPSPPTSPGAVG